MERKFYILLIIMGVILGFLAGYFFKDLKLQKEEVNENIIYMSEIDEIIEYNMKLPYTRQIFENCSTRKNESEKLLCVNKFAVYNYNNVPREEIYSIDDMFNKGADCKSYSIYYATLAKMMGYEYAFFTTPNHMMTLVYFDRGYCIMDQKFAECLYYEEKDLSNEIISIN